jgi:hypothetical protein
MYSPHRDLLVVFPKVFETVAESLNREINDGVLDQIEPDGEKWAQLVDALFRAMDNSLRAPVAVSLYKSASAAGVLDFPAPMRNHVIGRFGELLLATFVSMAQEAMVTSSLGTIADALSQARRDAELSAIRVHTTVSHAVHAIGIMTDPLIPAAVCDHPSVKWRWRTAPAALRPWFKRPLAALARFVGFGSSN